ncbi:MAG: flavodoxin family protein [Dissulfurispiraceae bacterium]
MKILNPYYSATGNTDNVAGQIEKAAQKEGHEVITVKAAKDIETDILAYDFIFIGSGVYMWMPGKPLTETHQQTDRTIPHRGNQSGIAEKSGQASGSLLYIQRRPYRS